MKHVETITLPYDLDEFSEIIDVRAPGEFAEDHLPGAVNLPVLNDDQRAEVGTIFKSNPFKARRLGAQLISNNAATHLAAYLSDKDKSYTPLLYCWRGGMRSNSLAHILRSIGWRARVLEGGYKAFRKFVTENLEDSLSSSALALTVLSGKTGVAKTRLLHTLRDHGAQIIDLEGLANHKGSVLGLEPHACQPSQKHFETLLWQAVNELNPNQPIFAEAESNRIGSLHCPPALWQKLGRSTVIEIQMPLTQRAHFLLDDYPYFTVKPQHLKGLLEKLIKLRGNKKIAQWHEQIDNANWMAFVESILNDHYDLVYRSAGDEQSNYPPPSDIIELEGFSTPVLKAAAKKLISRV
ncbi:MAG TPA: tRNA 2-selenouridine(34) synthase MnmH [Verrucomicrobiales bacterium]|jgi:tRNA 2-selenouridine synthase|nr:tRNA 2-selenouridine(34) synthase MnmH [Verrucomicrobiales bacterium]HCI91128.1 tRNA 2-selenouridine(34) synthase MnmH [Verrucomicrobiales bacterium]HCL97459.1 tRNA 2-selenouridine(34) synthase MnmH [Verrucomicrobiales bacterium]